ncbi:MAG: CDP-archaeol synthase [Ruminococcaceae bacterium]|nr:CDP-archaeol synthase [Oscillospiraceae bacterium]
MKKRAITGTVAALALLALLYLCPVWVMCLVACAVSVMGVYEFITSTGFVKNRAMIIAAVVFSVLVVPWAYRGEYFQSANIAVFLYAAFLFALALGSQRQVTLEQIGGAFFASIFIPMTLTSILRIRMMENGIYLVLLPFIAACLNDVCAYFTGVYLGHTKMAPGISPNKTWEGSVGGIAGAVVGSFLYGLGLWYFLGLEVDWTVLVLVAIFGGAAGQFGDLCFSYIKREFKIKDYGSLLPGHGGVLDRIDSILFAAPVVELVLTVTRGILMI